MRTCVTRLLLRYLESLRVRGLGSDAGKIGGEQRLGPLNSHHSHGLRVMTTAATFSRCGNSFSPQSCNVEVRGGAEI